MEKKRNLFLGSVGILTLFILWTLLVKYVDVQAIGPKKSSVGLAALNDYIYNLIGVNITLYVITDWLGLIPIIIGMGFAILGLVQWIRRKSLFKVDRSILILGGFYIFIMLVYIFFEIVAINYRPTLIDGYLEPSYPSSTTMLVLCVMFTAMIQFRARIKNKTFNLCVIIANITFVSFMIIGRIVSGVHWITDIIGSILLSTAIILMYYRVTNTVTNN